MGILVVALLFGLPKPYNAAPLAVLLLGRLLVWGIPHGRQLLAQAATDAASAWARGRAAPPTTWPTFMPSPILQIGWLIAIGLGLFGVVLAILWPGPAASTIAVETALWFGITVGAVDVVMTARTFLRWSLGRRFGLVVATVGAAVSAAVALSLARKAIFLVAGEEPGAFPASQTLFAAFLAPVAWLYLLAALSLALVWPFSIVGALRLLFAHRGDAASLSDDFLRFMRPVILCTIPVMVLSPVDATDFTQFAAVRRSAQWAIIKLDYWDRNVCGAGRGLSNRIDDQHISVVLTDASGTRLHTVKCPISQGP